MLFNVKKVSMKQVIKDKQKHKEALMLLLVAFIWNAIVFSGARLIAGSWHHYDMTTAFDGFFPFLPWTVSIYIGCFLFWGVNYYICSIKDSAERNRLFCADALSKCVCFVFFILVPTTNVRPEIVDSDVWSSLMKLLYRIDSADNLFPSIHCLVSWMCWIGVRKRTDISFVYRCFSLAMAVAICIVTLTTRQHVIVDVISGVALAEISYCVSGSPKISNVYSSFVSRMSRKFIK